MCPPTPTDARGVGRKRVLLVENHPLLGTVLAMRLDQEPDFEVAGLCASLAEARDVDFRECDVAIVDVRLPDGSGTELIGELHDIVPRGIPALALTESRDPKVHARASRAGASEVLTMEIGFGAIMEALRRVLGEPENGEPWLFDAG